MIYIHQLITIIILPIYIGNCSKTKNTATILTVKHDSETRLSRGIIMLCCLICKSPVKMATANIADGGCVKRYSGRPLENELHPLRRARGFVSIFPGSQPRTSSFRSRVYPI